MRTLLLTLALSIAVALGQTSDQWSKWSQDVREATDSGELLRARGILLTVLRNLEQDHAADDPGRRRMIPPLIGLGYLDTELKRFSDAEEEFQLALGLLSRSHLAEPQHAELKAKGLAGLSVAILGRQGPVAAWRTADESRNFARARFGAEHRITGLAANQLGLVYFGMGDYPRASTLFAEAVDIFERWPGEPPQDLGRALTNLCGAQARMGKYAEADPLCARAILSFQEHAGESAAMSRALEERAGILRQLGRGKEAKSLRRQAASLRARLPAQGVDAFVDLPYRR